MMILNVKAFLKFFALLAIFGLQSCDFIDRVEKKAAQINRFEKVALHLAQSNRLLEAKMAGLQAKNREIEAQNRFLKLRLSKYEQGKDGGKGRKSASLRPVNPSNDLVKFKVYHWKAEELLATARDAMKKKEFEKAAQYYQTFLVRFPKHESLDDAVLFESGIASYETGKHHNWTVHNLDRIVRNYPSGPYFRGAKLWIALTHLKTGNHSEFFKTVEEFRKKYRNTSEWKILSAHYEEIVQKYK